jgi:hypothetical protein
VCVAEAVPWKMTMPITEIGAAEDNTMYPHGGEANDYAAYCHGSAAKDKAAYCCGGTADTNAG